MQHPSRCSPNSLCRAFAHEREYSVVENDYRNGESQRSVQAANSRKRWRLWANRKLGLIGEINHYVSVFWWNQRRRAGGHIPSLTVTFGGAWVGGDEAFLTIGGLTLGKSVFPADTSETIAAHFAFIINATLVGVWAQAEGATLTITVRSPAPAYNYDFAEAHTSAQGTVTVAGTLRMRKEITFTSTPLMCYHVGHGH